MIYVTGDTHIPIDISKLSSRSFPQQKNMTKNDYVIICGDFGIWDNSKEEQYWLDWLNDKPFTTLFVDGNHENFDILSKIPSVDWNGGKVRFIRDSVIHLMRGEIYTLENKTFFTMGGASSVDRWSRIENKSWWAEELPSDDEYNNAIDNLTAHDWNVDYIITHCCADSTLALISDYFEHDKLTNFFEHIIKAQCSYHKWFFGHYHIDKDLNNKHICLYKKIVKII